ncbi:hypothetical protein Tco_1540999 [Tanacetum coccineum]
METIHAKFDELTTMASECNNSGPGLNCSNFQDSSEDSNEIPSKEELDNLFGPLYEEYYETRNLEVSDNFAANTLNIFQFSIRLAYNSIHPLTTYDFSILSKLVISQVLSLSKASIPLFTSFVQ